MSLISAKKAKIIKTIENGIVRSDIVNGVYGSATFTYGKNEFVVVADTYNEDGTRNGSSIMKNGKPYRGSIVSNGRYRDIALGNGDSLMEHQLLAICLVPGATKSLLDEETNNVINHKTIAKESVDARQAHYDDVKYWAECLVNGELDKYDKDKFLSSAYQPPCDARDLEICTNSQNYEHGAFIHTFGLYNTAISAHDVPVLKRYLIKEERVRYTMDLYTKYGADVMADMLKG